MSFQRISPMGDNTTTHNEYRSGQQVRMMRVMKADIRPTLMEGTVESLICNQSDNDNKGLLFVAGAWLLFYGLVFGGFGPPQGVHLLTSVM